MTARRRLRKVLFPALAQPPFFSLLSLSLPGRRAFSILKSPSYSGSSFPTPVVPFSANRPVTERRSRFSPLGEHGQLAFNRYCSDVSVIRPPTLVVALRRALRSTVRNSLPVHGVDHPIGPSDKPEFRIIPVIRTFRRVSLSPWSPPRFISLSSVLSVSLSRSPLSRSSPPRQPFNTFRTSVCIYTAIAYKKHPRSRPATVILLSSF